MSTIATGIFRRVVFKKQAAQGQIAAGGAATGRSLRRTTSTLDLTKAQYRSAEKRASMQRADSRHGVKAVSGTHAAELACGSFQEFFESVLRAPAVAAATSGALVNVTAAAIAPTALLPAAGTFTRAAGSWLVDGFKKGDIVRASGWTAPALANNAHNFFIYDLTATVMTVFALDKVPIVAKAAGDSVTFVQAGKKIFIPQTGHTRDYYTVEHWFGDLTLSERYIDVVPTGFTVRLPASGLVTVEFPLMGLDMQTGAAAYFTSPTAPINGGLLASVNGVIFVAGQRVGTITSLEFTVAGNHTTPDGVVGFDTNPDIFPGPLDVTGTATILFDGPTFRDMFINETVADIVAGFTTGNTPAADAMAFAIPNLKFGGAGKDDADGGLSLTMPFVAAENVNGGAALSSLATTISIMDTLYA